MFGKGGKGGDVLTTGLILILCFSSLLGGIKMISLKHGQHAALNQSPDSTLIQPNTPTCSYRTESNLNYAPNPLPQSQHAFLSISNQANPKHSLSLLYPDTSLLSFFHSNPTGPQAATSAKYHPCASVSVLSLSFPVFPFRFTLPSNTLTS